MTGDVIVTDFEFMPSILMKIFDYSDKLDYIRSRPFSEVFENIDSETANKIDVPSFNFEKLRKYFKFHI